jgi:hypothetical protein
MSGKQPRNEVLSKSTEISLLWQSYGSFYACMWVQFGDGEVGEAEAGLDRVWLLGLWMQVQVGRPRWHSMNVWA